MNWTVATPELDTPKAPEALIDVLPLLDRLNRAFGPRALSRLLGVSPGTVTNWRLRRRRIEASYAKRVGDLHDVLYRALRVFPPSTAMRWLTGHEPLLNGQRPIDVLVLSGAGPLIEALDGVDAGAYA